MFGLVQLLIRLIVLGKFDQAIIETHNAQYLYQMDDTAYFMDNETYDQYEIPVASVADELKFILENEEVKIQFFGTRSDWCSSANNSCFDSN